MALSVIALAAIAQDQARRLVRRDALLVAADLDVAFDVADQRDDLQTRLHLGIEAQRAIDSQPIETILLVNAIDGNGVLLRNDDPCAATRDAALVPGFRIAPGAASDGRMGRLRVVDQVEQRLMFFGLDRIAGMGGMLVLWRRRRSVSSRQQDGDEPGG